MTDFLKVKHVTKNMGHDVILKSICMDIGRGKIVGLVGPNGSGKTTLLKLLSGVSHADIGTIEYDWKYPEPLRQGSFVSGYRFLDYVTVRSSLEMIAKMRKISQDHIYDVVSQLGLRHYLSKRFSELSLGFQQRLGLAVAVLGCPEFVVLDEPDQGFDPEAALSLREMLKTLKEKGSTVLFSSHRLTEIERSCDEIYVLKQGSIVYSGPVLFSPHEQGVNLSKLEQDYLKWVDHGDLK
ncbi:MAG: ABC transporter ATP-binding protein [Oligoflexales bacterium]